MAVVHRTYPIPGSGGELASAICELFRRKNACVSRADIIAWAATGELYLASFLCGLPVRMMRAEQYAIREYHVPMNIDCSDYNLLYEYEYCYMGILSYMRELFVSLKKLLGYKL